MVAVEAASSDNMAQSTHNSRPWHLLIIDFAGATTMHGVRFLAEPTKFLTRRFAVTNQYTKVCVELLPRIAARRCPLLSFACRQMSIGSRYTAPPAVDL